MAADPLLVVVLSEGCLGGLRSLRALPLRIGAAPENDLVLTGEGVRPQHAELRAGARGGLEYAPLGGGRAVRAAAGSHFRVGPHVLALARDPGGGDPGELLARLGRSLPALFACEERAEAAGLLLEALCEGFGAEWGAFLVEEGEGFRVLRAAGERPGREDEAVSRRVLERLAGGAEPVLAADLGEDEELGAAGSIHRQVSSVIAARVPGRTPGAVYLERTSGLRQFSAAERQRLATACELAGALLARAEEAARLGAENQRLGALHQVQLREGDPLARMVGEGPAMRRLEEQLREVASSGVTALFLGESGTGKEMAARAVHRLSPRAARPFVPVHCMALSPELVESELFGHVKGAFSGAQQDRLGRFEMAHGGVLFLDELGELSPEVQVKLLRVLEERAVTRVGETRERPVDVQLLAATNANLEALVAQGRFREDLYYRVAVYKLALPPLRERREDLPVLVRHFLGAFARRHRKELEGLTPEAAAALEAHAWPGNLRELRNVLEQAVVREKGRRLGVESLGLAAHRGARGAAPAAPPLAEGPRELEAARNAWERAFILAALEAEEGNVAATCRRLGVSSSALYRRFQQHGIDPAAWRPRGDGES